MQNTAQQQIETASEVMFCDNNDDNYDNNELTHTVADLGG